MRALITGGAGFIGSHLAESLLSTGYEVTVLDDFSTGRESNLTSISTEAPLRVVKGSVCEADVVAECISGADAVFHLAAAVGQFSIRDRTLESLRTNLYGTETVIAAAHRVGARFLLASTSEIYGLNTKIGLNEDDLRIMGSALTSRWSYSEAKAIDEVITHTYVREHGLRAVIVRLFNTVGPRQTGRYGMVIPRFVAQAMKGEPLTVFGSGEQVRCFGHVLDVIPAMAALLADDSANGSVFNLGNAEPVSINALAAEVLDVTGSRSSIVSVPYDEAYYPGYEDVERRIPDCDRARRQVGFVPTRNLRAIISDVVTANRSDLGGSLASGHR